MQTHWRLALMFNAAGGNLGQLEATLRASRIAIRSAAGHPVRLGVADRHPDLGSGVPDGTREVDGAIEVSIPNSQVDAIGVICASLQPLLAGIIEPGSVHLMAGPMFHMVPVRTGNCFLSLAFRREPGTTSAQFRDWWFNQHSKLAIPVLGEGLLAYDQVHVDQDAARAAAAGFGADYAEYDAYDNLTWADRYGYLHSISDPVRMAEVFADEEGRIGKAGKRFAIMQDIG